MLIIKQSLVCFAVLSLLFVTGCSYSTRPPSLPIHAKSIALPVWTNKTYLDEYTRGLEVEATDAARNAFVKNGSLRVTGREEADLILEGQIIKMERAVLRTDRYGEPAQVQLRILGKVSLYDVHAGKYLFKEALVKNDKTKSGSGTYDIHRGEFEQKGRKDAMEDFGDAVLHRVLDRW